MRPVSHNVTHSTWNPSTLQWDYYSAVGGANLRAGVIATAPRIPRRPLGVAPEDAARPLPSSARPVGSGKYPRGLVARKGLSGVDLGGVHPVLVAAAAYVIYRVLRRR